jgi:hypothetical protein
VDSEKPNTSAQARQTALLWIACLFDRVGFSQPSSRTLAASLQIGTALALLERDLQTAKPHLREAESLVNSVREELTDLVHELRPGAMDGEESCGSLCGSALDWAQQNGIEIRLDLQDSGTLPLARIAILSSFARSGICGGRSWERQEFSWAHVHFRS